MITPRTLRELTLAEAPGRAAYLSAASGLVCVQSWLYVVADDEHHLGVFRTNAQTPGRLIRLIDGDLPDEKKLRKKQKPDFEVLLRLPAFGGYAHGALLAMGSGSRDNRRRGVLLGLNGDGVLQGAPNSVDLTHMLAPLEDTYPALNIEGAVALGNELLLVQRGNQKNSVNAVIRFSLPAFLEGLEAETSAPLTAASHRVYDLGHINGIPLTFTDAVALPSGDIVFSAVAEDTEDTYNDGACTGAALGLLAADGTLRWVRPLATSAKIEGIDVQRGDDGLMVLMVTDADDVAIPAQLLSATLKDL
jgi:hypothetical protein